MSSTQITVSIALEPHQAQAFLRWLENQREVAMAELWHKDRYRLVPSGLRGPLVLRDHPHIAGLHRTARELRKQVQA